MDDKPAPLAELLAQCQQQAQRSGGPGGQHRQRNANGVCLIHQPSGISITREEERDRQRNLASAQQAIALQFALAGLLAPEPIDDLIRGRALRCGPKAKRWPMVIAHVCAAIRAHPESLADAAAEIGLSTSQLIKACGADKSVRQWLDGHRQALGLKPIHYRS